MANTTGNKFGGRTKGTPNKLTKELRELLKEYSLQRNGKNRRIFRWIRTQRKA